MQMQKPTPDAELASNLFVQNLLNQIQAQAAADALNKARITVLEGKLAQAQQAAEAAKPKPEPPQAEKVRLVAPSAPAA